MSQSKLVSYTNLSPNFSKGRTHAIDTITIHCFVGNVGVKVGVDCFKPSSKQASCQYVVAVDGQIGQCVLEENRSWCTGGSIYNNGLTGSLNDQRAITIEVACDPYAPYKVSNAAYNALIELVVDICKRNNIKKLVWSDKKDDRINHRNGCNMTIHCDYAYKACPGDFILSHMCDITEKANSKLGQKEVKPVEPVVSELYRVRKSWSDAKSQLGAYKILANAKAVCKKGYKVYNSKGDCVYNNAKKSNEEIAREVIAGKWGNGESRKAKLKAAGYDYAVIQAIVNKLC